LITFAGDIWFTIETEVVEGLCWMLPGLKDDVLCIWRNWV